MSEWPLHLGEFSEKMKTLNGAQFGAVGAKEWLTDRYDDLSIPASWVYRKTGKETDTPPIVFQFAPRLNILATSSEEWFFKNLAVEDSAGGFVPRWLLIRVTGPGRDVAIPPDLDERALGPLGFGLNQLL